MHLFSLLQSNYKINCAEQIPLDISTCGHPHRIPERAKSLIQRRIGPSWNIVGRSIRKNLMLVLHGPLLKAWIARALETSGERGLFFMSACIRHCANEKCKQRKNSLRYWKWRKPRNQCHQQQQEKISDDRIKTYRCRLWVGEKRRRFSFRRGIKRHMSVSQQVFVLFGPYERERKYLRAILENGIV